jgi:FkbM family methyltransferase
MEPRRPVVLSLVRIPADRSITALGLDAFQAGQPNVHVVKAAASAQRGTVDFFGYQEDPYGGAASQDGSTRDGLTVNAVTIDEEVESLALAGPYYLKLDTHGFEVPILEGAAKTLKQASLVQIEVYNFRLTPNTLLFDEMVGYMRERGFGVTDLSEPLWRVRDQAFWQIDLLFEPLTNPIFGWTTYR